MVLVTAHIRIWHQAFANLDAAGLTLLKSDYVRLSAVHKPVKLREAVHRLDAD